MRSFFTNKKCKICRGQATMYRMEAEHSFYLCDKKSCHTKVNPETIFKNLDYLTKEKK